MLLDLRYAVRRLVATPLFTVFAVLSLAAGIGVTTAFYSVVRAIFLREDDVRDPDRVAIVISPSDSLTDTAALSGPDLDDLRAAQRSFSAVSGWTPARVPIVTPSTTEIVAAEAVDGAYFAALGVRPLFGRAIDDDDDRRGAAVAVLSHRLWHARFGSRRDVVGGTVRIAGRPFEVIGVAPPEFDGLTAPRGLRIFGAALWIPLHVDAVGPRVAPRDVRRLRVFGRLAPGVTIGAASAELGSIAARLDTSFPPPPHLRQARWLDRAWSARSMTAPNEIERVFNRLAYTLIVIVGLVLVVACTNLSNLVLARGTTRQQELAVRCALGASRWRLMREQLTESVLLAAAGGAASYLIFRSLQLLFDIEFGFSMPFGGRTTLTIHPELDTRAVAIAVGSLLVSLVVFGVEPAFQLTRTRDVRGELANGAAGATRTLRHRMLLRWQVAISAGFFIIATMFVKYTVAEARHASGLDMDRFAIATVNFETQHWDEARAQRTLDRVLEEARTEGAIESTSMSTGMPFGAAGPLRLALAMPGTTNAAAFLSTFGIGATPTFFHTIGVPIVRGRGFTDGDHAGAAPVVVLSEFTARTIFGSADAVGREVLLRGLAPSRAEELATVVGIARDTDVGSMFGPPRALAYVPFAQRRDPFVAIAVRASGGTAGAVRALQQALRRADPDLAVDALGTARDVLAAPFVLLRGMGTGALALGGLTLLLAMVGLFGIQSHIVATPTREIGVRISFGASRGQIQRMILRSGSLPVLEGLAIGLLIGIAGRGVLRYYMEIRDVAIVDVWMLAVVPVPLVLAGLCACLLPARRAASVDPSVALRHI